MSGRLGDKTFAELGIRILQGSEIPILPPTRNRTITVPGRHGAYDMGADLEPRVFNLECAFVNATTPAELQQRARALAAHLMDEYGNPRLLELVFDIEPDKVYYVRYAGDLPIDRIASFGRFTLPLVAYDPFAYSTTEKTYIIDVGEGEKTITNDGTAATYPTITVHVQQPTTFFAAQLDGTDKYILLGNPNTVEQTPKPELEQVLYDQLTTMVGWGPGISVDGGVISGSFYSDGEDLRVSDYGSGSAWHGPAIMKGLPEPLTDFRVIVWLTFYNKSRKVGRLEAYLLDQNNGILGKVALKDDLTDVDDVWGEARVGPWQGGVYFVNTHGLQAGVWNQYHGVMQIERKGNVWSAFFGKYSYSTRQFHTRWAAQYIDKEGKWTAPLAAIQLHAGAYGTNTPADAWFNLVSVYKINTIQETEVPYIAMPGDVIEIDTGRYEVRLNGYSANWLLDPSSQFFPLPAGESTILIAPQNVAAVEIKYKERWL